MSDNVTIARPYAKAIFNHALAINQLAVWSVILQSLAQVVLDPLASRFISNPDNSVELQHELLMSILGKSITDTTSNAINQDHVNNLIRMLVENRRLMLLPDICVEFELLRAEQEKTLAVQVVSFAALTKEQENHLIQSLSKRLQRKVVLNVTLDKTLLGGAVVYAGDFVIDGSVRGKLTKLGAALAA